MSGGRNTDRGPPPAEGPSRAAATVGGLAPADHVAGPGQPSAQSGFGTLLREN